MDIALARLVGFSVALVLSVIYTGLFAGAIYTLRNRKNTNISAVIPGALIFMFVLNVVQLCLQAADVYSAFFKFQDTPDGANAYFLNYGSGILPARDAIFWILSVIADALVCWRLYAVWLRNKLVLVVPVTLLIAGLASGIVMFVYTIQRMMADSTELIPIIDKWWMITLSFTIAVNVVTPGLIIGRLWYIARQVGVLGSRSSWPYKHIALALMESGSLYTVAVTAWLIIFAVGSLPALYMSACILPTIVSIVPTLIILRINTFGNNPLSRLRHQVEQFGPTWAGGEPGIQITVTRHRLSSPGEVLPSPKSRSVADMESSTVEDEIAEDRWSAKGEPSDHPPTLATPPQHHLPVPPVPTSNPPEV